MVNLIVWNVRGLNGPNKQEEVKLLCNNEEVGLIGLLENKVRKEKFDQVATKLFNGWSHLTNLETHHNGRILIAWRPDYYTVVPMRITA